MTPTELNEINLVEIPAHQIFEELGYEVQNAPDFNPGKENEERKSLSEVLLKQRLRRNLEEKICPGLPPEAYDIAIKEGYRFYSFGDGMLIL